MADFSSALPHGIWRASCSGAGNKHRALFPLRAGHVAVSDRLTLTLGLRYEAHTPWVETKINKTTTTFRPANWNFAAQNGNSRSPIKQSESLRGGKAFQPRPGFAPGRRHGLAVTPLFEALLRFGHLEGTGTNLRLPINPPFETGVPATGANSRRNTFCSRCGYDSVQGIIAPACWSRCPISLASREAFPSVG